MPFSFFTSEISVLHKDEHHELRRRQHEILIVRTAGLWDTQKLKTGFRDDL